MKLRHSETLPKPLPTCFNNNLTTALILLVNSLKVRTSETDKSTHVNHLY